jgi:hypothetical protein
VIELRAEHAAALSVGAGRLQGQGQQLHALYGIVIGIAGLLALFLTILFVVKGSIMFPAAAALAGRCCLYRHRLRILGQGFRRCRGRRAIGACIGRGHSCGDPAGVPVRLSQSRPLARALFAHHCGWLAFLARCSRWSPYDPPIASGIARFRCAVALVGLRPRRLSLHAWVRPRGAADPDLVPAGVWVLAAGLTVPASSPTTSSAPALLGGLVLIVMLIGFTVMQHAFAGVGDEGIVSDVERRALALTGAGDMIWDWDVPRDQVYTSHETEQTARLEARRAGDLRRRSGSKVLHAADRDRFRWRPRQRAGTAPRPLVQEFRLRTPTAIICGSSCKRTPGGRLRRRGACASSARSRTSPS